MDGQMSLFDFLDFNVESTEQKEKKTVKRQKAFSVVATVKSKVSNYLEKGERIETLAREKFQRIYGKEWNGSELEEKIFTASYEKPRSMYGEIHDLAPIAKAFRTVLRRIDLNNPEDTNLQGLKDLFGRRYNMEFERSYYSSYDMPGAKDAGGDVMKITLRDHNKAIEVHGLLKNSHPKKKLVCRYRSHYEFMVDLGYMLAYLFMLMTVEQKLKEVQTDHEAIFWHKNEGLLNGDYETLFEPFYKATGLVWYNKDTLTDEDMTLLQEWVPMAQGLDSPPSLYSEERRRSIRIRKTDMEWFRARLAITEAYKNGHIYYFDQVLENADQRTSDPDTTYYHPLPSGWYLTGWQWYPLFLDIVEEKGAEIRNWRYLKALQGTVATACQTKKNIPEKTLKAMEESEFNNYFGYVEFDEDVDIEKATEIAKEFIAVKETFFPGVNASENALRLRKLGKHRALGLYYPFVQCLCVDINSPSSFIHEFGHLIDYTYGRLSQKYNFYEIRQLYGKLVDKAMGDNDTYKGSSKYNREYFLNPTEIFARSFEIYCSRCLGIKNSLLERPSGYEAATYPSDEGYLEQIKVYFDRLLVTINTDKSKEESVA